MKHGLLIAVALMLVTPVAAQPADVIPAPAALVTDGMPPVPVALRAATQPYMEFRTAGFVGWNPAGPGILIATRFGNTNQLHSVAMPGGARTQISFEPEPVANGGYAPGKGDVLLVSKDIGGNENFQLYTLKEGRLALLTDGRSRHTGALWSRDGTRVAYASNARNGRDSDLYVMDPRDPKSATMILPREGGGWAALDWSPDGKRLLIARYVSVQQSELHLYDVATKSVRRIDNPKTPASYGGAKFAADGTLFVTSDLGSEFQQLGTLDPASGRFVPHGKPAAWDVEAFDLSPDGRFIAVVTNEDGASKLRLLDAVTANVMLEPKLPTGVIGGLEIAQAGPNAGKVGFTLSSATSPADAYSVDPASGAVTRWTMSETGGLDPAKNREPELVRVKSFDGLMVSGFLYRPDPAKFPGRRPLIVSIHGGPEAQTRPGFQGRNNYLLNEMGVAIFYPNVRGSTGYGKRFVSLDNGPFLRENSVKDVNALVGALAKDGGLDATRFAVTGGSYGGYMTYGSLTLFPQLWRAGIGIVGISDFVTFLKNTAEYRRDLRRVEYGDERDPKQRAKLKEISPLGRAETIRVPLMVVTGGNDPRVPASEADQIVAAVRKNGGQAWHLLARNEGHGFAKKENQDYQFWSSVQFWQRYLLDAK
ncbi:prolyl oligopeptidase family serine peptidase [Sandaracinobacteroides saxicola]|uniref:Prolyl oligopeptidase family serine peptidase n=2 Tax=Sandaracinobacteroides saxicola TaxID=2759707 RepID=A0A7G5IM75_9SPHN|nr:prolyl oligopeptidase family serine peptidase [Sandaracinobacteroides saxicola]